MRTLLGLLLGACISGVGVVLLAMLYTEALLFTERDFGVITIITFFFLFMSWLFLNCATALFEIFKLYRELNDKE